MTGQKGWRGCVGRLRASADNLQIQCMKYIIYLESRIKLNGEKPWWKHLRLWAINPHTQGNIAQGEEDERIVDFGIKKNSYIT